MRITEISFNKETGAIEEPPEGGKLPTTRMKGQRETENNWMKK